ncbi:MAG: hypothetical protein IKD10_12635 [Lentisphaeria bacterium]|nr:hypothetical protein [Lentisphaeria bacterium]
MDNANSEKEYFFCRKGMKHIGPLSRNMLRRYLSAGLIDTQTLLSLNDNGCMLPLGASAAADEITWTIRAWNRRYSFPVYLLWLFLMPLFSSAFAAYAVYSAKDSLAIMLVILLIAQLGVCYWLWRLWHLLLVDKHPLMALFYALPMALPVVNLFWIWIGYFQLPKHGTIYKDKLDIKEPTIYWIYYVAIIFFYAMTVGLVLLLFVDHSKHILLIHAVGVISWLWFGATLLSLFRADYIVTKVIQKKLSNLAFGSLKFCADIDYDILHKTVLTVASSVRNKSRILALTVLILSWLVGGCFWLYVLKSSLSDQHKSYWNLAKDCIFCNEKGHFFKNIFPTQSTFVNTNAERQGK